MHVVSGQHGRGVGGDGLSLGDLLGFQAIALEHVLEVHVATNVELVGAVQDNAAVFEQLSHDAVRDGCTDLALDVIAHDRHAGCGELVGPFLGAGNEDGEGVDEGNTGVDGALCVELRSGVGANGQVAHHDVNLGGLQRCNNVNGFGVGLNDGLAVVLAQTVKGVSAQNGNVEVRHVCKLDGVVLAGANGLREIQADLLAVNVECSNKLHVVHVVLTELNMHQTRNLHGRVCIVVVLDALDQR